MPRVTKNADTTPSAARHHRQVLLQIWLPLGIAILLVLGLAVLAVFGTVQQSSEVNRLGNLAVMFLILPILIVSVLYGILMFASIRGVMELYKRIPNWSLVIQYYLARLNHAVNRLADRAVAPIFAVQSLAARMNALKEKLTPRKRTRLS